MSSAQKSPDLEISASKRVCMHNEAVENGKYLLEFASNRIAWLTSTTNHTFLLTTPIKPHLYYAFCPCAQLVRYRQTEVVNNDYAAAYS